MQIVYVNAANLPDIGRTAPKAAMALGYFDGVHLGHQKVIRTAKEQADAQNLAVAVLSFFPHPKSVLFPDREVAYLEPLEQKAEKLERLGVELFYVVEFTKELAKVEPDDFLNDYIVGLNAQEIVCGFDYTYGAKAKGTVETLAVYADVQQVGLTVVEELKWNEQKISSTLIRQHLADRQLSELPELLGTFHQTKYCQKNGLLPNYSLPNVGTYKVRIETPESSVECVATVKCKRTIQLNYDWSALPKLLKIHWMAQLEAVAT
ncbi:riboflavin kinase / FMN adenylyltransferase [Planococcus glaciei]|uniref:FAD synthetase family protein n=1 Tax=Planococcus glaciei TaxID=459472 RepID=UPI00087F69AF|nr:FAD synthetase family protein [Planococcus glaciei]SDG73887.1 riboflavin kinase / FMN adenylyltransferase [Planococcus glaciei]